MFKHYVQKDYFAVVMVNVLVRPLNVIGIRIAGTVLMNLLPSVGQLVRISTSYLPYLNELFLFIWNDLYPIMVHQHFGFSVILTG